ncbi:DUF2478 domain-containing protein [Oryzibacter oryziterrae]|uniref:DUF2478 domain-containing protein n=1 Tax=Oryzibacter oryziterrae TaxID=2766474 RepID=UPI001F235B68|nr:DUF2478 domain-containing protein [Oryzibacter oryziterrae]
MCETSPLFSSETDIAAVVYQPGDDPDGLLAHFARLRLGEGYDVLGLLQRRRDRSSPGPGKVDFRLMPAFEWDEPAPALRDDRPASTLLPELGRRLADLLPRRPDLLLMSRYGRAETRGEGLIDLLSHVADTGIPTLIAVPEALFPHWTQTTAGMAVRLCPSTNALERWWTSLGLGPRRPLPAQTGCVHAGM